MSFSLVRNFGATDSPTGVLSCMDVGVRVAKVGATIPLQEECKAGKMQSYRDQAINTESPSMTPSDGGRC